MDTQKVMLKNPPCISTGGLKKEQGEQTMKQLDIDMSLPAFVWTSY